MQSEKKEGHVLFESTKAFLINEFSSSSLLMRKIEVNNRIEFI